MSPSKPVGPRVGQLYADSELDEQKVEVLHVSETHVIVQAPDAVSRYTKPVFGDRFSRARKDGKPRGS